jgi:hypothetical protein
VAQCNWIVRGAVAPRVPDYHASMLSTGNQTLDYILYGTAGAVLLFVGYRVGRMIGTIASSKLIASKEQELFTAQKGFKNLYESEISNLKSKMPS